MIAEHSVAFLTFAVVAAITPGPSNVMITTTGAKVGLLRGLPCAVGAATGMAVLLAAAALGLGRIVLLQPLLLDAMKLLGAAFLLFLAWKIARSGPMTQTDGGRPVGFLGAALFQWANPKGWLVAVSAAGAYGQNGADALALGGLFFLAALPSGLVWLALGALLQAMLRDAGKARAFNLLMAALLAGSVLMLS